MRDVLNSMMPMPKIFRVVRGDPRAKSGSETELRTLGDAARYLENDFDRSFADDLSWKATAVALEEAHLNAANMPQAVASLEHLLQQEGRLVEPHPGVTG